MLVSEAIDRAYGWLYAGGANRPSWVTLNGSITDVATTANFTGTADSVPDRAILEIESELILNSDTTANALTFNERGYRETTAASHATALKIYINPDYYRIDIFNAIVSIVEGLPGMGLWNIAQHTSTTVNLTAPTDLPSGAKDVIGDVMWLDGTLQHPLKRSEGYDVYTAWDPPKIQFFFGRHGATTVFNVKKDFTSPDTEARDLTTYSGVPAALARHIPMAAAGTLLMGKELPRVQIEDIRRRLASEGVQVGASLNVGQTLTEVFERKYVSREIDKQTTRFPVQTIYSG